MPQLQNNSKPMHQESDWYRLLYMLLFIAILNVIGVIMSVLIPLQFILSVVTQSTNENLKSFSRSIAEYVFQVLTFLTYNSDEKPYPFSDWPSPD